MRLIYWGFVFIIALFIAMAVVLTFVQPEFNTTVGAQIFTYKTKQLPVYYYVIGAFGVGLIIGVLQALYTFFHTRAQIFHKNGRIKDLERQLADAERRIATLQNELKLREPVPPTDAEQSTATPENEAKLPESAPASLETDDDLTQP